MIFLPFSNIMEKKGIGWAGFGEIICVPVCVGLKFRGKTAESFMFVTNAVLLGKLGEKLLQWKLHWLKCKNQGKK